jgi:hypothetical protein
MIRSDLVFGGNKMRKSTIFTGLFLLSIASPVFAETLGNEDVIQLSAVGLGNEAIIAKIKASANKFELTTDKMIELKSKGVSGPVIAAMLEMSNGSNVSNNAQSSPDSPDPLVPHPSGIYLLAEWLPQPRMLVMDPTTSNQTKTGGFLGYALTGGIASMSFNTVIPNANARNVSANGKPVFYFYFDQAGRSLSGGATNAFWQSGSVTSPNEFSLVRFKVKKNSREAKVGKFNIGGAKSGVMDKDRISFEYENVAPGVFKVFPLEELQAGEYGFLYSSTTGGGGIGGAGMGATTSKVFDFSIK